MKHANDRIWKMYSFDEKIDAIPLNFIKVTLYIRIYNYWIRFVICVICFLMTMSATVLNNKDLQPQTAQLFCTVY